MKQSLFIELYHGRKNPKQSMDNWGEQGPVFGPFHHMTITYAYHVMLLDSDYEEFAEFWITPEDLIYYDGVYYGDWAVFCMDDEPPEMRKGLGERLVRFDKKKAELPEKKVKSNARRPRKS